MRISPRCRAVTGLACVPPWTVNAGIAAGDRTTLVVDTGASALSAETILGYAEAARPGNALLACVTEPHLDHILGISTFRARGVDVLGHRLVARSPEDLRGWARELEAANPDPARRGESAAFLAGARVENPNVKLDADRSVDLGGATARLLLAPGHTPANLVVHVPEDGVVFAGDCVVEGHLPNLEAGGPSEWAAWLGSLDRIAALAPRVLVPGHGRVVRDGGVLSAVDAIRRTLEAALRAGAAPTRSA